MNKNIIIAGIFLVVAGFVAAGSLLYSKVWDPSWNPFRPSPEELLKTAILESLKLEKAKTKVEGNLSFQVSGQEAEVGIVIESLTEKRDPQNIFSYSSQGTLDFSGSYQGVSISGSLEFVSLPDAFYFRLKKVPFLPLGQDSPLSSWVKVENTGESFIDLSGEDGFCDPFSPDYEACQQRREKFKELGKKLQEDLYQRFSSPEDLVDLFEEVRFLRKEVLVVNGVKQPTYVLETKLSATKILKTLREVIERGVKASDLEPQEKQEILRDIEINFPETERNLEQLLSNMPIRLWVGTKDNIVWKVEAKGEAEVPAEELGQESIKISFVITSLLLEKNPDVTILPPREYKPLEEILKDLFFSGFLSGQEAQSGFQDFPSELEPSPSPLF